MNRRSFFGAAATLLVAPVAPKRVYSFLWDNPLIAVPGLYVDSAVPNLNGDVLPVPGVYIEQVYRRNPHGVPELRGNFVWSPDMPLGTVKSEMPLDEIGPYRIVVCPDALEPTEEMREMKRKWELEQRSTGGASGRRD